MKYLLLLISINCFAMGDVLPRDKFKTEKVWSDSRDWKISALHKEGNDIYSVHYDNKSRKNIELRKNFKTIFTSSAETASQPVKKDGWLYFPAENDNHFRVQGSSVQKLGVKGRYAAAACIIDGEVMFGNSDGKTAHIQRTNGTIYKVLKGKGIPSSCSTNGSKWIVSISDGSKNGLEKQDGSFKDGNINSSSFHDSKAYWSEGGDLVRDGKRWATGSEKVTHVWSDGSRLWVAGASPDKLLVLQNDKLDTVSTFAGDPPQGGSLFDGRVTNGYYSRAANKKGEIYKVIKQ